MIFVDANVVLEILLNRPKFEQVFYALSGSDSEYCISTLSVHLAYHFGQKDKLIADDITQLINSFRHLPLDSRAVVLAQKRYKGKGFEDCLQAAAAELGGCDEIITLDTTFAIDSSTRLPVKVIC